MVFLTLDEGSQTKAELYSKEAEGGPVEATMSPSITRRANEKEPSPTCGEMAAMLEDTASNTPLTSQSSMDSDNSASSCSGLEAFPEQRYPEEDALVRVNYRNGWLLNSGHDLATAAWPQISPPFDDPWSDLIGMDAYGHDNAQYPTVDQPLHHRFQPDILALHHRQQQIPPGQTPSKPRQQQQPPVVQIGVPFLINYDDNLIYGPQKLPIIIRTLRGRV
jgi:hypothetical protein